MTLNLLLWPVWWYTQGWLWFSRRLDRFLRQQAQVLHLNVWLRYLFVPMFGVRDRVSRLISLVIRLLELIFRALAWLVFALGALLLLLAWLICPPLFLILLGGQILQLL